MLERRRDGTRHADLVRQRKERCAEMSRPRRSKDEFPQLLPAASALRGLDACAPLPGLCSAPRRTRVARRCRCVLAACTKLSCLGPTRLHRGRMAADAGSNGTADAARTGGGQRMSPACTLAEGPHHAMCTQRRALHHQSAKGAGGRAAQHSARQPARVRSTSGVWALPSGRASSSARCCGVVARCRPWCDCARTPESADCLQPLGGRPPCRRRPQVDTRRTMHRLAASPILRAVAGGRGRRSHRQVRRLLGHAADRRQQGRASVRCRGSAGCQIRGAVPCCRPAHA